MSSYYVNKNAQTNGDHEVHTTGCRFLPAEHNRIYLGEFYSCAPVVTEAKKHYTQVNGCIHCSNACHTQQLSKNHNRPRRKKHFFRREALTQPIDESGYDDHRLNVLTAS